MSERDSVANESVLTPAIIWALICAGLFWVYDSLSIISWFGSRFYTLGGDPYIMPVGEFFVNMGIMTDEFAYSLARACVNDDGGLGAFLIVGFCILGYILSLSNLAARKKAHGVSVFNELDKL